MRRTTTLPLFRKDSATESGCSVSMLLFFPGPTVGTRRNLQQCCHIFHSRTRVICYRVSTALAYTFAGPSVSRKPVFSDVTLHRVGPISTLRTHSTLVAEQVTAHPANSRFAARANWTLRAVAGRERRSTCDQVIHVPKDFQWRHGIICCIFCTVLAQ